METPQVAVHIEHAVTFPILDTKWIPQTAKFIALGVRANGTGALKIFELNEGTLDLVREINQKTGFRCGSFGGSTQRTHLAAGNFEGGLQILDIERLDGGVYHVKAHETGINCVDSIGGLLTNCGPPEIVTGGCDGFIKVWDPRQDINPVVCIAPVSSAGDAGSRDCWTVAFGSAFNNQERCVCAGFDNGDIKMFDLRQLKTCWETNVTHGVCGLEFDRADSQLNRLVASTTVGSLHIFEFEKSNSREDFGYYVEKEAGSVPNALPGRSTLWSVRHLPQNNNILATCTGSGHLRLWLHKNAKDIHKSQQEVASKLELLQTASLASQSVNCFQWSPDRLGLAVCGSFDQIVRVVITANLNLY